MREQQALHLAGCIVTTVSMQDRYGFALWLVISASLPLACGKSSTICDVPLSIWMSIRLLKAGPTESSILVSPSHYLRVLQTF